MKMKFLIKTIRVVFIAATAAAAVAAAMCNVYYIYKEGYLPDYLAISIYIQVHYIYIYIYNM